MKKLVLMLFVSIICVAQEWESPTYIQRDSTINVFIADSSFRYSFYDTLIRIPDTTYYSLVVYIDMENIVKVDSCYTVEIVEGDGLTRENIKKSKYSTYNYLIPGKETMYYLIRNNELLKYKRIIVAFP